MEENVKKASISKINQDAKITSVEISDALQEFNYREGTMRAIVSFAYCANGDGVNALLASLVTQSGNTGNVIIDLEALDGETIDDKLSVARDMLVDKIGQFSTFVFTIESLTDGKDSVVNNNVKNYRSLTQHYLGSGNEEVAYNTIRERLFNQVAEGLLNWGSIEGVEEEQTRNNSSRFNSPRSTR